MKTLTKKSYLLGSCALAMALVAGTSEGWATDLGATPVAITAPDTTTRNFNLSNTTFSVSGTGSLIVNGQALTASSGLTGLQVSLSGAATPALSSKTDVYTIDGVANTPVFSSIVQTSTNQLTHSGVGGIVIGLKLPAAGGTTAITTATGSTISATSDSTTANTAIKLSESAGATGAMAITITNAGTISAAGKHANSHAIDASGMSVRSDSSLTIANSGTISIDTVNNGVNAIDASAMVGTLAITNGNGGTITGAILTAGMTGATNIGSVTTPVAYASGTISTPVVVSGNRGIIAGAIGAAAGTSSTGALTVVNTVPGTISGLIGGTSQNGALAVYNTSTARSSIGAGVTAGTGSGAGAFTFYNTNTTAAGVVGTITTGHGAASIYNTGTLDAVDTIAQWNNSSAGAVSIYNSGTISGTVVAGTATGAGAMTITNMGTGTFTGSITNGAGGLSFTSSSSGTSSGAFVAGAGALTIANSAGTLSGTVAASTGAATTVTNSGAGAMSGRITGNSSRALTVVNSGATSTISGGVTGGSAAATIVSNTGAGTISTGALIGAAGGTGGSLTINNTGGGTISSAITSTYAAVGATMTIANNASTATVAGTGTSTISSAITQTANDGITITNGTADSLTDTSTMTGAITLNPITASTGTTINQHSTAAIASGIAVNNTAGTATLNLGASNTTLPATVMGGFGGVAVVGLNPTTIINAYRSYVTATVDQIGQTNAVSALNIGAGATFTFNGTQTHVITNINGAGTLGFTGTGTATITGAVGTNSVTNVTTAAAPVITVDQGASAIITGAVSAQSVTLGTGTTTGTATIQFNSALTGAVDSSTATTAGQLNFNGTFSSGGTIGATNGVQNVGIFGGNFTLQHDLNAGSGSRSDGAVAIAIANTLTVAKKVGGTAAPTVNAAIEGAGTLAVTSNFTTSNTIGQNTQLTAVNISGGSTVNTNYNINAANISLASATDTLAINAKNVVLGGNLVAATADGQGKLLINSDFTNTNLIGTTSATGAAANNKKLAGINVASGATFTAANHFDAQVSTGTPSVTVADGGTLSVSTPVTVASASIKLSGRGVGGNGALVVGTGQSLTLTGGNLVVADGASVHLKLQTASADAGTASPLKPANTLIPVVLNGTTATVSFGSGASLDVDLTQIPAQAAVYQLMSASAFTISDDVVTNKAFYSQAISKDATGKSLLLTVTPKTGSDLHTGNASQDQTASALAAYVLAGGFGSASSNLTSQQWTSAVEKTTTGTSISVSVPTTTLVSNTQSHAMDATSAPTVQALLPGAAVASGNAMGASGLEFWGRALGSSETQNAITAYSGYTAKTGGFTLGANTRLMDGANVGLSFTFANTKVDEKVSSLSKTKVQNYLVNLTGSYSPTNTWFVDGVLTAGSGQYKQDRLDGFSSDVYNSKFGGTVFNGMAKVGQNVKIADGMLLRPFAASSLGSTTIDAHTETGGVNNHNLTVGKTRINTARLGAGASISMVSKMGEGWTATPNVNISYMHEFCSKGRTVQASMVGIPNLPLNTGKFASEILSGGVGVKMANTEGMSVSVDYSATGKDNFMAHTGMVRVAKSF